MEPKEHIKEFEIRVTFNKFTRQYTATLYVDGLERTHDKCTTPIYIQLSVGFQVAYMLSEEEFRVKE